MTNEEYPVLTQFRGTLNSAKIAEEHGRSTVLAEPFGSRMGWFSLSDLQKTGRAEKFGFYGIHACLLEGPSQ
jgi:hypothetical protein